MRKRRLLAVPPAALLAPAGTLPAHAAPTPPPAEQPTTKIVGGVPASGPALIGSSGRWRLVGATSRGTASTCATSPAIYGDVTAYRTRIQQIIGGAALG